MLDGPKSCRNSERKNMSDRSALRRLSRSLIVCMLMCLAGPLAAEQGMLVVQVQDVEGHPVDTLEIATKGDGSSARTDRAGKARIRLAPATKPGARVSLQIVRSPRPHDYVYRALGKSGPSPSV